MLYYGASDWEEDEVVAALGGYVGTMVSLLGGFTELDLSILFGEVTLLDGMSPLSLSITDSAVLLDEDGAWTEGLYQVSMELWD